MAGEKWNDWSKHSLDANLSTTNLTDYTTIKPKQQYEYTVRSNDL